MKVRSVVSALFVGALCSGVPALPSFAAKSPAMEACSAQWADMKKAGKTVGQTWPQFWSQCSKDYAAKNGGGAAETETTTKSSKKVAAAPVDESDSTGSGQQKKDCDAKWGATRQRLAPMVGTIISSSWPNARDVDAAIGGAHARRQKQAWIV